ncbi:MAG: hypothetical protein QW468_02125 [Candidatus Bathyarchaeia archaeon]
MVPPNWVMPPTERGVRTQSVVYYALPTSRNLKRENPQLVKFKHFLANQDKLDCCTGLLGEC